MDEERFTTDGKVSTLNFTPTNNQDYGTLYCEGQNVIGHQEEPCTFQIVPTGKYAFSFIDWTAFKLHCYGSKNSTNYSLSKCILNNRNM